MARISQSEMPQVTKAGRVSKYAAEMAELEELLAEEDFGAGEAVMFEIDKDNLSALVSSLRKVGRAVGRKINTVYAEGSVYARDGGPIESESATTIRKSVEAKSGKANNPPAK